MIRKYRTSLAICLKATTLLVSFASGYGHALAGTCSSTGGGSYLCSGVVDSSTDTTVNPPRNNPLTVTTSSGFGIDTSTNGGNAFNLYSYDGLTFTDANSSSITGKTNGILAVNMGTNSLSISSNGQITGTSGIGIWADNRPPGTDLAISAADVWGLDDGINANNAGSGRLSISVSGTVEGQNDNGIYARNSSPGSDLSILTVDVSGGNNGIVATNNGNGRLTITSTGDVSGTSGIGIWANNSANGTGGLAISAKDVFGGNQGVNAINSGGGSLSISASGTVEGQNDNGIYAQNSSTGSDLSISTVDVSGGDNGIVATNNGNGLLTITSTGDISGISDIGIWANNSANGTGLTISAKDVFGGNQGINAKNYGNDELTITSGDVTGSSYAGIWAENSANGTDLTISSAETTSNYLGIVASNSGSGTLSISSSGTTTGTTRGGGIYAIGTGIYAKNSGTDLIISAAEVHGGIGAANTGSGELTIT